LRTLFYALFLLAVLVASIILLRRIEPEPRQPVTTNTLPAGPVVGSRSPERVDIDSDELSDASADELFDIGEELLRLWHVREATEVFEQAVAADSSHYLTWVKLVECYAHPIVSREDAQRSALRRAQAYVPSKEDSFFLAGLRDLYIDRDYVAAVGHFTTAGRIEGSHRDTRFHLARAYMLAGKLTDAGREVDMLLESDETVARVIELDVRLAVERRDLDVASQRARDLARLYSEEPLPYVLLAQIELLRGDLDEAVSFCENALLLDPRFIPAILTRANLYAEQGDMGAARVSFEKLLLFEDPMLRAIGDDGVAFAEILSGNFDAGTEAMNEAVRYAMLAGSPRRGLSYAVKLIDYLCELGRIDAAETVVERWVNGFGAVPRSVARLHIELRRGNDDLARRGIVMLTTSDEWKSWARAMGVDERDLNGLLQIRNRPGNGRSAGDRDEGGRARFFEGYGAFERGDAEVAAAAFTAVRTWFYGLDFPYRGDPVLFVQSLFYLGECSLASGVEDAAQAHYEAFLGQWGDTGWDLVAVARAREKLESLREAAATP